LCLILIEVGWVAGTFNVIPVTIGSLGFLSNSLD